MLHSKARIRPQSLQIPDSLCRILVSGKHRSEIPTGLGRKPGVIEVGLFSSPGCLRLELTTAIDVDRSYSAYRRTVECSTQIPPTKLVDRSYSAYKRTVACASQIPPTKLVDRSYSAYKRTVACSSQIPPTKLVDRSYSAYKRTVACSSQI